MLYDPAFIRLPAGTYTAPADRLAAHLAAFAAAVHNHRLANHLARLVERLHRSDALSPVDKHLIRRSLSSDDRLWLAALGDRPEPLCQPAATPPLKRHRKKPSRSLVAKILLMHQRGVSRRDIARRTGSKHSQVSYLLRRSGRVLAPDPRHYRVVYQEVTYPSVAALARGVGIEEILLRSRLDRGWAIERAVTAPLDRRGRRHAPA